MKRRSTHMTRLNRERLYLFAFVFYLIFTGSAIAADSVVVIVNADNPANSLSISDVKKYYENDLLRWPDGKKITLYDLKVKDKARRGFSNTVLGREPGKIAMEWANRKITNTAKNPPRTVQSSTLMQARVGGDSGAIGYLRRSAVTSNKVKIVTVIK
jgi:ABC-type phosphate transport system substrate-binding protein